MTLTREEETNERNACDEWFHERGGASIQEAWVERARRAAASEEVSAKPVAWMTEDGRVATDETKTTAMPNAVKSSFTIPLYARPVSDYASLHMTPEQAAKEAK